MHNAESLSPTQTAIECFSLGTLNTPDQPTPALINLFSPEKAPKHAIHRHSLHLLPPSP
jgi:hypothetical protein